MFYLSLGFIIILQLLIFRTLLKMKDEQFVDRSVLNELYRLQTGRNP